MENALINILVYFPARGLCFNFCNTQDMQIIMKWPFSFFFFNSLSWSKFKILITFNIGQSWGVGREDTFTYYCK